MKNEKPVYLVKILTVHESGAMQGIYFMVEATSADAAQSRALSLVPQNFCEGHEDEFEIRPLSSEEASAEETAQYRRESPPGGALAQLKPARIPLGTVNGVEHDGMIN